MFNGMTRETLAEKLAEEDLREEDLDEVIKTKKEKLRKLSEEGKALKKINTLTEEIKNLEEIAALRDHLAAATVVPAVMTETPEMIALKEELARQLAEEDIENVAILLKKIEKKSASIVELKAKGAAKKAEKLEEEVRQLVSIKEIAERIATLTGVPVFGSASVSVSAAGEVSLSAPVQAPPLPLASRSTDFFAGRAAPSVVAVQESVVAVKPPRLERSQSFEELQEIQASFAALETVPECAEKSLAKLCGHFQNEVKKKKRVVEPLLTPEEVLAIFDKLKSQLAEEQLNDFSVNEKLKAIEAVLASADAVFLSGEFWKLLKEIQPLDMELMLSLIAKTKEAAKQIENQDIILLLGGTGAGKSTTIHWLAGSRMQKTFVAGLKHIAPVEILGSELESVTTSPFTRSETRSINAVKVNLEKMGLASGGEVVLCDTPGFGDTDGPEVDIANGKGVVDVVRLCRSVKPLILISQQSIGDRLEGIGKLSRVLVMFIGAIQTQLPTFSYGFTKYLKGAEEDIHPLLSHKLSHLPDAESSEPAFVALLTDIVNKTKESIRVIDPISDRPADFLRELVRTPSIKNPQDVFRDFVTEESQQKLKDQLAKHKSAIIHALSSFNIPLLDYKLNQLKVLSSSLDLSVIQKAYKESLQEFEQCIHRLLDETFFRMRKSLEDGNTSIEDDLKTCSNSIAKLIQLEPLRSKHLAEFQDLEDTCATELKRAQSELLDLICQKQEVVPVADEENSAAGVVEQKGEDLKPLILISPKHAQLAFSQPELTVSRLDKMRLLVTILKTNVSCMTVIGLIDTLERQYKIACDYLDNIFKESCKQGVRAIESLEFDSYVREMDRVKFIREHFSAHLDGEALNAGYQNLIRAIFDYSMARVSVCITYFQQTSLSLDNIKEIQAVLDVLIKIQRTEGLATRHVSVQDIVALHDDVLQRAVTYLDALSKRIISLCEQDFVDFSVLLQLVLEMDQLRSHAEIDYPTTSLYQLSLDSIRRAVYLLKEKLDEDVTRWSEAKLLTCDQLVSRLSVLRTATVFQDHPSRVYANEFRVILEKLEKVIIRFSKYFKEQAFSLGDNKQVLSANKAILQLQAMLGAKDIYPDIIAAFEEVAKKFQEKILTVFDTIPSLFQFDETAERSSIRDGILYLQACENVDLGSIRERQIALEAYVRSKISEYFTLVRAEVRTAFELILAGVDSDKTVFRAQSEKLRLHLDQLFGFKNFYHENKVAGKAMAITDGRVEKIDMYQDLFELRPLQLLEEFCLGESSFCERMAVTTEADIKALLETKNTEEMYKRLKIVSALVMTDEFRAKEAVPKFKELALQLENAIRLHNASVVSALRLAAQTGRYEELKKLVETVDMRDPAIAKEFEVIKQELIDKFFSLLSGFDARIKVIKSTDLDIFKELIKDFFELRQAAEHLPADWIALIPARLYPCEQRLYSKVCDFCGKSIDEYIDKNQFKHAEDALKRVEVMADLFGEMKSPTDFCYRERVVESVQKKRKRLAKQLETSINRYATLDLPSLASMPPIELFYRIEEAVEFSDAYARANTALVDNLQTQLIDMLRAIARETDKIEEAQQQLTLIESIRTFLPPQVSGAVNDTFKEAKAHVQSVIEKFERELAEDAALGKIKQLVDSLIRYSQRWQFTHMSSAQVNIRKLISDAISRFKTDLTKGDLATVLENLPRMWDDWKYYTDCFGGLSLPVDKTYATRYAYLYRDEACFKMCNDIKTLVATKFNDILKNIDRVRADRSDGWKTFATYFDHLMAFLSLRSGSSSFYHELVDLDRTLDQRTKSAFVKIQEWVKENQDKFKMHLDASHFHELQKVMDIAQEMEGFFVKLVDESKKPFFLGDLVEFKEVMHTALSYRAMRSELARRVVQWKESVHQRFLNHERTRTENILERNAFYAELSASYKSLKQVRPLGAHVDTAVADVNLLETQSREHVEQELTKLGDFLQGLLTAIPTDDTKVYADFNIWYDNLRSFIENVEDPGLNSIAVGLRNTISKKFGEKIVRIQEEARSEADVDKIVIALIKIKSVMIAIPAFKPQIDSLLNDFLKEYKQAKGGAQKIGLLGVKLNEHSNSAVAQRIINEHSAFHGYALSLRNEKTLRFTAADVVAGLEGDDINKASLLEQYEAFDKEYWALVERGLTNRQEVQRQIKEKVLLIHATVHDRAKVISLMAHVFAWWTLSHAQHYSEAIDLGETASAGAGAGSGSGSGSGSSESKKHYLMQPHAAQIISIFRLLGIESIGPRETSGGFKKAVAAATGGAFFGSSLETSVGLSNHLVQIGTGEGKSVILAMVSTILALLGYDVDCACYSDYLSRRDYEAFQSLFNAFAVGSFVHYGTFNQLCENFINQRGDVRALVEATLKSAPVAGVAKEPTRREKVLLIDEVDVFFNKDFYGNMYRPVVKLTHPSIQALIDYLWSIRGTPAELRLANVKRLAEYQSCLLAFRGFEELIEESVKTLLYDLKTFESHDYVVVNGRVGYKEQDGLSFEATYGYKTLFAHYKESAAKTISGSLLRSKIGFYIDCGNFSYAEMPKNYKHIMGVSGTLKTLSRPEQRLLQDVYSIRKRTFTPSVYGKSNLEFSAESTRGIMVESSPGYFSEIRNEINRRLASLDGSVTQRAVLVFFESTPKLMAFYRSRELFDIKDQVRLMTEEVSAVEKEGLIRQAVTSGSVTLLTREFGRGTDFICYDDSLLNAGGVHVIQTFVSDELSEETQIKGRTARQGNRGSYSMVLLEETLERFGILHAEIERMKHTNAMYSTIDRHRTHFFEGQYPESMRYVDDIKADHQRAQRFVSALVSKDTLHAKAFLVEQNRSVVAAHAEAQTSRTICLMDATGSMSGLLQKSKNTVKVMFERAAAILEENGFSSAFELQFAVYRNYSSGRDLVLQYSTWEFKPANLRAFMDSISTSGGQGNEAVEIGLWHVNQEIERAEVTQVILIGDMPPNTRDEVTSKRAGHGEAYWASTPFAAPTHFTTELEKIRARGIPVHAFYVKDSARAAFSEIASATGGRTAALDIDSEAGAAMLTDLVTEKILENVGGAEHGERLVSAYRAKFARGYISAAVDTGEQTAALAVTPR